MISGNKPFFTSLAIAFLYLSQMVSAEGQQISAEAEAALQYYLDVNCTVGDNRHALQDLAVFKAVLEAPLIDLARNGFGTAKTNELELRLAEDWMRMTRRVRLKPHLGLKDDNLEILKKITQKEYIEHWRKQAIREYRERAVFALAAFNTENATKALDALKKSEPGFGPIIDAARKREQAKQGRTRS